MRVDHERPVLTVFGELTGTGYDEPDLDALSRTPPWVQDFVQELEAFPNGAHDDQVDAMTQALDRLIQSGPRVRVL